MTSEKDVKTLQKEYWKKLTNELIIEYPEFRPKRVNGNTYYLPLGKKFARISISINTVMGIQECKVIISNKLIFYNYLEKNKGIIEERLKIKLNWEYMDDKKSYIGVFKDFDIKDESSWDEAIKWHLEMASKFYWEFSVWVSFY